MRVILLLAVTLCPGFAADLAVGTATAGPGHRADGFLRIPPGSDAPTDVPVIVIQGASPGPVLALVSGAHGTEYASIIAAEEIAKSIDPKTLRGSVIVLPLLNVASFQQKTPHINPVDRKNMNRFYPGKADGTQTERISAAVAKEVVAKCDYLLDFHGGDLDENLRKYAYWPDTGNAKLGETTHRMALAMGLDHIIIQNMRNPVAPGGAVTVTRYALDMGKPAIAVEAGHAGTTNAEDIAMLVDGTLSVMRELKMLPGAPKPVEHPLWLGKITTVTSDVEGIFHPLVEPEAYVQQGMILGYVTNYFGERIRNIAAPVSGVVGYICSVPSMAKGGTVANVAELASDPQK
jgi:predicted deacylase